MASNDFLTFAGGSGANVLSQADYAALTAILNNGFSAGTALSVQINKVLRQASIMSAVLAQFAVDLTGSNAVDDGTTATLLAMLKAAVSAQSVGVVGTSRNAKMYIATAGTSGTFTADEVILESALGGQRYCLANVSDTFNLTTDMDTGTAPVSGFVALYKLYNPTTRASIRRIVNATSAIAPEIYAGAAAPAGFTASALLAVLPTAGGQFAPCSLVDRTVTIVPATAFSTINTGISYASFSVAGQVPINAKKALIGAGSTNSTQGASLVLYVASTVFGLGAIQGVNTYAGPNVGPIEFGELPLLTPQTLFWKSTNSAGSPTFNVYVNNYTF